MAELNKQTIKTLVSLCRISCSEDEQLALLTDLQKILAHIDQLNEINTDNVSPCNQVISEMSNVMREDEIGQVLPREKFLENVPSQIGGMVRVPPVLKSTS